MNYSNENFIKTREVDLTIYQWRKDYNHVLNEYNCFITDTYCNWFRITEDTLNSIRKTQNEYYLSIDSRRKTIMVMEYQSYKPQYPFQSELGIESPYGKIKNNLNKKLLLL